MGKDLFIFVKYTHIHKRTRATFKFLLTHTLYLHSPVPFESKKREMNRKYWIILVNEDIRTLHHSPFVQRTDVARRQNINLFKRAFKNVTPPLLYYTLRLI